MKSPVKIFHGIPMYAVEKKFTIKDEDGKLKEEKLLVHIPAWTEKINI